MDDAQWSCGGWYSRCGGAVDGVEVEDLVRKDVIDEKLIPAVILTRVPLLVVL